MGRLKNLITKITNHVIDKTVHNNLDFQPTNPIHWELPKGQPKTEAELLEDNKLLVQTVDPKINFILNLIDNLEILSDPALDYFVKESYLMKLWLAHVAYKDRIDSFYNLINNKTNNLLDPSVLVKKSFKISPKQKTIKCITDLPLQKKILN